MNSSLCFPLLIALVLGATQLAPFAQGQPAKKPTLSVA
jgi:hypothetical protein